MKLFVDDFNRQMIKATEILASDWLRANLSVKIPDQMLHENAHLTDVYAKEKVKTHFEKITFKD